MSGSLTSFISQWDLPLYPQRKTKIVPSPSSFTACFYPKHLSSSNILHVSIICLSIIYLLFMYVPIYVCMYICMYLSIYLLPTYHLLSISCPPTRPSSDCCHCCVTQGLEHCWHCRCSVSICRLNTEWMCEACMLTFNSSDSDFWPSNQTFLIHANRILDSRCHVLLINGL